MCLPSQNPRFPDTKHMLGAAPKIAKTSKIGSPRAESQKCSNSQVKESRSQFRRSDGRLVVCGGRLMLKASREKAIRLGAREVPLGAPLHRSTVHDGDRAHHGDRAISTLGAPATTAIAGDGAPGAPTTFDRSPPQPPAPLVVGRIERSRRVLRPKFPPVPDGRRRPDEHDVLIGVSNSVYASRTLIDSRWDQNALFAASTLSPGQVLGRYTGPILGANEVKRRVLAGAEYLMDARATRNANRFHVIDGEPTETNPNLPGRANYSSVPNARFEDDCNFEFSDAHKGATNVLLIVAEAIPAGTEIRVDYDGDDQENRPYREMLLLAGVSLHDLDDPSYKCVRWEHPASLRCR